MQYPALLRRTTVIAYVTRGGCGRIVGNSGRRVGHYSTPLLRGCHRVVWRPIQQLIKFELRKLDLPASKSVLRKRNSHPPHYVVLGGVTVLTQRAAILGTLCGRKCSDRFRLTFLPCSLLTYSSSVHCVRVSIVPVYGMASSGCSHSAVHYWNGGLPSQSRNVGISISCSLC